MRACECKCVSVSVRVTASVRECVCVSASVRECKSECNLGGEERDVFEAEGHVSVSVSVSVNEG